MHQSAGILGQLLGQGMPNHSQILSPQTCQDQMHQQQMHQYQMYQQQMHQKSNYLSTTKGLFSKYSYL